MQMKIVFLCLSLLFFSCSNSKKEELLTLSIDEVPSQKIDLSAFVDSVEYILLDTNLILPTVSTFIWSDTCFFVDTREGILKYSTDGKFIRKIGDIGEGPGEYPRYYYGCMVDNTDKVVYVYLKTKNRLQSFTLSGELINDVQVKLPADISSFYPSWTMIQGDLIFLYYNNAMGKSNDYPIYWCSIKKDGTFNEIRRGYHKKRRESDGIYGIYYRALNDSMVVYHDLFNDTIFHVSPTKAHAAYHWEKGDFRLQENDEFPIPPKKRRVCTSFIETNSFLLYYLTNFNVQGDNVSYYVIYDKSKKTFNRLSIEQLLFDKRLSSSEFLMPFTCFQSKGREYLVCKTNAGRLKENLETIVWSIDKDDIEGNPVLVLMRLKE